MTKEQALAEQKNLEARYTELQTQSQDIATEMNRLQGEYRAYQKIIDEPEAETTVSTDPELDQPTEEPSNG